MTDTAGMQMWATATSRNDDNGRAIIFRYIQDFDVGFDRRAQPVRITLAWNYDSETGIPASDERERMDALEDALEPGLERNGFANLVLVSTGEGLREWTYYASSEDAFLLQLNHALSGHPPYPIDIHISEDPEWKMYDEFKRNLAE